VSKRQPIAAIEAARAAGLADFGENYAQELRDKQQDWPRDRSCRWHYIGALQSNKLKYLVGKVDLIHTVDRLELIEAIDRRAVTLDSVQEILLEVAIAGETQKAGAPVDALPDLLRACARTTHLRCVGLMIIPPDEDDPEAARRWFRLLREHRDRLREDLADLPPGRVSLEHLSMGMSADYEQAIEEGATLVRVGTAIFGPRPP
ncbi:MAG: YggS family pyridoxal phosphate-dependent enzyme, partial [Myxococcales bacterium]|nr:YggS family pyridoxal phosphate-dependent enzyme [Myxococcales bacterium]